MESDSASPVLDGEQARALYEVCKLVTDSLDLDATLEAVVQAAHSVASAHATALALLDPENNLVLRVARGPVVSSIGARLPQDHGITGRAFRECRPILVPDMLEEPDRARPDLDAEYGVRCFVAVPLIWHSERLGVVTLAFNEPGALEDSELALVYALAELAGAAVKHAREYAEEQRLLEESRALMRQVLDQQQQLERVQRQLMQNEKLSAIGQLAQGLAHEMNTPLGVVITNLSVLGRYARSLLNVSLVAREVLAQLSADPLASALAAPLEDAVRSAELDYMLEDLPALLDESSAGARRVAELVRSVRTFARRESRGPQPVRIEEVLEAALNLASNALRPTAKVVLEYAEVPRVLGLASELTQVFVHLLMNAAQALADTHGTVTITTRLDDGRVSVTIADTGCGIAGEHLERIFEPFFTTRAPGEGTGMGLAVCYSIVHGHGGSINVHSELGKGTCFTVALPLATTDVVERAA